MRLTRRGSLVAGGTALALAALLTLPGLDPARAATSEGLVCQNGTSTTGPTTFDLTARTGTIATPDGNSIFAWGYGMTSSGFQLPGPNLCVSTGQAVTVVLHNTLPEPTSIVVPGMEGVQAGGSPVQPQTSGGTTTSLVQTAPPGGAVTYTFTPTRPGTYLYESGTDVDKQVQMGLYGALVVRPAGAPNQVNTRADSAFDPAHEYVYLLSEIDPAFHLAVEQGRPVSQPDYRARYFLINGRSMPDTVAPNGASWLPAQPYGALVHIRPQGDPAAGYQKDPAVIRYLNAGSVNYPFHPHGSDQLVIDKDAAPLAGPAGQDLAYDKFLIDVSPGETVDALLTWKDVEKWDPATNPVPVALPNLQDQIIGPGNETWFSESPYLGASGSLPSGVIQHNECGEYYQIAHSHALEQATNYGASFGGMMTLIRIDPPNPNTCLAVTQ
jgi:FtsP/CotA-like multicopper oxidase with cupredoxin domain